MAGSGPALAASRGTRATPGCPGNARYPGSHVSIQDSTADPLAVRVNKLDLLERLADDLAHEIKNPLHSMVINLEVLKRRIARAGGPQEDVLKYIGVLGGELERVNRRIELLLRLSRPGRGAERTSLAELADELMELVQLEARHHGVTVEYDPGERPAPVEVRREPARQVILNLVLEVLDALDAGGTLRMEVRTGDGTCALTLDGTAADGTSPALPGEGGSVSAALAEAAGGRVERSPVGASLAFVLPPRG